PRVHADAGERRRDGRPARGAARQGPVRHGRVSGVMGGPVTLAVVGGGRMGEAIVAGLLAAGTLDADRIAVAEPAAARRDVFERHGVRTASDAHAIVAGAEIVLLAVKPQVIDAVLAHLADDLEPGTVLVSI